jgi:hypothetical protein
MENNFVGLREKAEKLTIEGPRNIWEDVTKINRKKAYC